MKKTLTLFFCLFLLFLTSCARGGAVKDSRKASSREKTLTISYYTGDFGGDWMKKAANGFQSENTGLKIQLAPDDNINENILKAFNSGAGLPDVALLRQTNWQYFSGKGWLSRLDAVYSATEDGKRIIDKLQFGDRNYGKEKNSYYVLPWTSRVTGFVYNEKIFSDNGYAVPATFEQLGALIAKMHSNGLTPFVWAGKAPYLWDNVVMGWWEQYEGSQGVKSYQAMQSPEVYRQRGRLIALQEFESIISDSANCLEGSENLTEQQMAAAFFKGRAAMIPETSDFGAKYKSMIPLNFEMGMMRLPAPDGAKGTNMNNAGPANFFCVPMASNNKGPAMDFLRYLYTDNAMSQFRDSTGIPQPTDGLYDGDDAFTQTVFSIWQSSDNVYLYSQNPLYYDTLHDWPYAGKPYLQIFSGTESARSVFDKNYLAARQAFLNAGCRLPSVSSAFSEPSGQFSGSR